MEGTWKKLLPRLKPELRQTLLETGAKQKRMNPQAEVASGPHGSAVSEGGQGGGHAAGLTNTAPRHAEGPGDAHRHRAASWGTRGREGRALSGASEPI